jgi:predicted phage tail protein
MRKSPINYLTTPNYSPRRIENYGHTVINSYSPETRANGSWGVLRIAMDHDCEERLGNELLAQVDNKKPLPALKALQASYLGTKPVPIIPARQQDLASYDHLLQGNWHRLEAVGHA